jgi:glycosyltransferase 2 family protein
MSSSRQARPWLVGAARVAFSILLLALLFHFLPVSQLWAAASQLSAVVGLAVLGAYVLGHVVAMLKWRMMVNLAGAALSYTQAARCYFGGLFGTLFFPSVVGGDVVRLSLAMRDSRNRTGTALACVLDRAIDFAALACLAGLGVALLHGTLDAASLRVFWWLAALAGIAGIAALACLVFIPARRLPHRVQHILEQLRSAWRALISERRYVVLALVLGIAVQSWFVFLSAQIAGMCGLHVPMQGWLVAWPLAKLSALVPITQGGIGVCEFALAALLAPFGAPMSLTVAVGLVWEAIIVVTSLLGGALSFVAGRFAVPQQAEPEPRATRRVLSPGPVPLPDSQD